MKIFSVLLLIFVTSTTFAQVADTATVTITLTQYKVLMSAANYVKNIDIDARAKMLQNLEKRAEIAEDNYAELEKQYEELDAIWSRTANSLSNQLQGMKQEIETVTALNEVLMADNKDVGAMTKKAKRNSNIKAVVSAALGALAAVIVTNVLNK